MAFIEHWHIWLIIAFIILIVELMSGTYFLLALAGGGALTSMLSWWLMPLSISSQVFIFAITSGLAYLLLLSFRKEKSQTNNDGTTHMLGQRVEVLDAIQQQGRVRYKGVLWQAVSDDVIPAKAWAEIVAVNGSTLTVKIIQE